MSVDIDDLRLLVRDDDENAFSDEALEVAIAASGDSILRAAAIAFRSLAAEYSVLGRSVSTDDLNIDIRSRGKDLNAVADSFMKDAAQADADAAADFFAIVPQAGFKAGGICRVEGSPYPVTCNGYCGRC